MKVNELMIDDWVYRPDCYDQVKEISNNGIIGLDSLRGRIMFGELKPISLTSKILDKNFDFYPNNSEDVFEHYWWSNDYFDVTITEYAYGIWQVEVDEIEMGGCRCWQMFVSNIHELQHALRLCGIDKEIII